MSERERDVRTLLKAAQAIFDANIIGILIWTVDDRILEANQAFLGMLGYSREDLVLGKLRRKELTPAEWRDADDQAIAELKATGSIQPREKEYFRKDGSRVPVLVGAAMLEGPQEEGVAFVLDLSERKRADTWLDWCSRVHLIVYPSLDAITVGSVQTPPSSGDGAYRRRSLSAGT